MNLKTIILFISLIFFVIPVVAVPQTVSFTQTTTWTCPSDVNTITSLKMIGSGAGGMGGYAWWISSSSYGWGNGAGGANGTYIEANNIRVIPGQSYLIVVGTPGIGSSIGGTFSNVSGIVYGNGGQNSSAFGYVAKGGVASSITVTPTPLGSHPITITLSHSSIGGDGYGNYQIAGQGGSGLIGYDISTGLATSYGSLGGVGYGAGGGAGGGAAAYSSYTGGAGGNGAYGYVEFTYDSASTQVLPIGYVIDASTSSAISGSTVNILQNAIIQSTTSAADGSFSISNQSFTVGVPITITTTKTGYGNDSNTFIPLVSGVINLTIPMIPLSDYTNTTIVGITRDSLYGNPLSGVTYYAQDTITSDIYTATSNANGLAIVSALNPSHYYFVWANKTDYDSPSPVLVKPYS